MQKCSFCQNLQSRFFVQEKQYCYYFCGRCQTIFLFPPPSKKEIRQYYQKKFQYEVGSDEEKRIHQKAKIILKNLIKLNPDGRTLLDIGFGRGFFLVEANKFGLKTTGIEPSKSLYSVSINQLINTNVINKDFQSFAKNNRQKFDFITLIHVFEHLDDPKQIIQSAIKLLNRNGILYIETPNLSSHLFLTEKQNYTFLTPPDHLWIFSKRSLEIICQDIPQIEIIKTATYSYSEHFMGIIKNKFVNRNSKSVLKNRKNKLKSQFPNNIKYFFFDQLLAPLFTPLLNIGGYGSILELYIKKK